MRRSAAAPSDVLYRFGEFILDPVIGRLHRDDDEVVLTRKTFAVLLAVVERHGTVVSKADLFRMVWPDAIVEENNLARCVSMLRKALREHGGNADLIQTVSGHGYQFVGVVASLRRADLDPEAAVALPAEPRLVPVNTESLTDSSARAGGTFRVAHRRAIRGAAIALAAGVAACLYLMTPRAGAVVGNSIDNSRLWRLTSIGSLESEPTWSPDGQFIAYSSDRSGNHDIWIQSTTDNGEAVALTTGPAREWQPAWSPDGRRIAYRSEEGGGQVVVKPVLSGAATTVIPGGYLPRWSPDSTSLLLSDSNGHLGGTFRIVDAATGARLASFRLAQFRNPRVQWHPKDHRLSLYAIDGENGPGFWSLSTEGKRLEAAAINPEVKTRLERNALEIRDFVWAPDGRRIYLTGRADDSENIWAVDVDPMTMAWVGGPDRLTTGSGREQHVAVSADGRKLAFTSGVRTTQAWAFPFDAATGRILGEGKALTPGGVDADVLDLAPDGRLVYRTTRRNSDELWLSSGRDVTLLATELKGRIVQPRWSHDGRQIAYFRAASASDSRIVVLDANIKEPPQFVRPASLTNNLFEWTADGAGALVGCRERSGRPAGICLASLRTDGPSRVLAAHDSQSLYQARLSPDGKWISFIATDGQRSTVYLMPKDGGPWNAVTDGQQRDDKPRWAPDGSILYYLSLRDGFWNLWGRRVNFRTGTPAGEPFQVSKFYSPARRINFHASIQIGVSAEQLVLPLTEATGAVWILENSR